jgi:hypothetical protein
MTGTSDKRRSGVTGTVAKIEQQIAQAADAPPQACAGTKEKLACKMRQDGLKDCCCLLYYKL